MTSDDCPADPGLRVVDLDDYDNSTGTHPQTSIDACRLADGTFTQLRLSAIAVSFAQLSHNVNVPVPSTPNCRVAALRRRRCGTSVSCFAWRRWTSEDAGTTGLIGHGVPDPDRRQGSSVRTSAARARGERYDLHRERANDRAAGFKVTATEACRSEKPSSDRSLHSRSPTI